MIASHMSRGSTEASMLPTRCASGAVHDETNRATDLGGEYVLLSERFIYFGDQPKPLPDQLLPIVKQGQEHRSTSNEPYAGAFAAWITGLDIPFASVLGEPQWWQVERPSGKCGPCGSHRREEGQDELHDHSHGSSG